MNFGRLKDFFTIYPVIIYQQFKSIYYLIYGTWKILKEPSPRVAFFGGSRILLTDKHAEVAKNLAYRLVEQDVSIITGGGPGIMQAANYGATEAAKKKKQIRSLGVGIQGIPGEKGINIYAQDSLIVDNFFVRKWLLMNYSVAFLVFPGGYGTMDELTEVLTLIETKKMPKVPVILFGKEFWKPFMDWVINSALKEGTVTNEEIKLITVTDDIDEVFCLLLNQCKLFKAK